MCAEAGAKLGYPPYSPDLGPIEDFFFSLGLKVWLSVTGGMKEIPVKDLMYSWNTVSWWLVGKKSARGHFRHAGPKIEVCHT
jgi:hypothetical protein